MPALPGAEQPSQTKSLSHGLENTHLEKSGQVAQYLARWDQTGG